MQLESADIYSSINARCGPWMHLCSSLLHKFLNRTILGESTAECAFHAENFLGLAKSAHAICPGRINFHRAAI